MMAHRKHREKVQEYLRGDVPMEEAEVGRIDRLLRNVMNRRYVICDFSILQGHNYIICVEENCLLCSKQSMDMCDVNLLCCTCVSKFF